MPKNTLTASVVDVYLGLMAESIITTVQPFVQATFEGFEGDKHAGWTRKSDSRTPRYLRGVDIRNDRQVSIVSVEELKQIAEAMGIERLPAEWLGANLLLEGIPNLTQLPPMMHLYFPSGAALVLYGENHPCTTAGRAVKSQADPHGLRPDLAERFVQAGRARRGLVACVEHPGKICPGDQVILS